MDQKTDDAFTAYLRSAIGEAEKHKYYPNDFKKMLAADGGFVTVNRMLAKAEPSKGFVELWKLSRLDLSCEAIVVESEWRQYFDPMLVARAEKRLRDVRYRFTPYQDASPPSTEAQTHEGASLESARTTNRPPEDIAGQRGPSTADLARDLHDLTHASVDETTLTAMIEARLGQGRFRRELMKRWADACAVTGCGVAEVLRASHCKPWRDSSNVERLDPANGLLLVANLDALFDAGLISFDGNGQMLVARALTEKQRSSLGLPAPLRIAPSEATGAYLRHHRMHVFVDAGATQAAELEEEAG